MPYQDPSDFRQLPELARLAKPEAESFVAFDRAVGRSDGAIPPKYRELIAIAVGLTTPCAYCLDVHTGRALEAGATREELAEVAFVTASLRAGAALGPSLLMLKLAEQGGRSDREGGHQDHCRRLDFIKPASAPRLGRARVHCPRPGRPHVRLRLRPEDRTVSPSRTGQARRRSRRAAPRLTPP